MDKVQPVSEAIVQLKWNEIAELSMQGFATAECVYIQSYNLTRETEREILSY